MFSKLLKAYRYGKTITGMKPKIAKTTGEKIKREFRDMGRTIKAQSKKTTDDVSLKVNEVRKKLNKMREPKMGGGMMGRPMYKKGSKKAVGKSNFGMLSVKAGIDNNPKPTQADRIAGATMKKKK
jgi:hypothetical protein|tara:strand:- start:254 stop:628 length:375 start_codon:yes stop_codon:yes gene_type:complete